MSGIPIPMKAFWLRGPIYKTIELCPSNNDLFGKKAFTQPDAS